MLSINKPRVSFYIDGFNFYYGFSQSVESKYKWLNLNALTNFYLLENQIIGEVHYFTSRITGDSAKQKRQNTYLEALDAVGIHIHYGLFKKERRKCGECGYNSKTYSEKGTDVNIAVQLLADAFDDNFDISFLVTGDSDLVPLVNKFRALFPEKKLVVAFPPNRGIKELMQAAESYTHIGLDAIRQSRFPEIVKSKTGFNLRCPTDWLSVE
jgi:uncharacterized LabA/DUF88 family protein